MINEYVVFFLGKKSQWNIYDKLIQRLKGNYLLHMLLAFIHVQYISPFKTWNMTALNISLAFFYISKSELKSYLPLSGLKKTIHNVL